jgi:hypothetical protein
VSEQDILIEEIKHQPESVVREVLHYLNPDFPYKLHKPMLLIYNKAA